MRLLAVLLAVTLTGPAVGVLICDFACAAHHADPVAADDCHQPDSTGSTATVAGAHACHELSAPDPTIVTGKQQIDLRVAAIAESPVVSSPFAVHADVTTAPHAPTHAQPPTLQVPLRI